jgi:4-amino-4-deoxy-L-arabinose transferase-like glycosyltransferase
MLKKELLLIFFTGVIVFTIGLSPEFIGFDCRFAVFAQEMLRNGPTFFPTTYGNAYPDYHGTSTFLIYLVSLPFGKVTPFTAILPTAIVSALVLVFIYKIGAIHSRRWGLAAVLFALFTIEFFSLSRSISIDQYTTLSTVISFYIVYSASVYKKQKRLWLIPFLFMAGFAFRGPIGLIIPASVVCSYYLYNKDYENFAFIAFESVILLVIYTLILLAAAWYQGGETFVKRVIETQVTGRIGSNAKHWFGYYFTESFARYAISFPFAFLVVAALYRKIFKRVNPECKLLCSLIIWVLVILIGISITGTKKIRYILPIIPAISLIGSYIFVDSSPKSILYSIKKIFLQFCSWFPFGTTAVILSAWILSNRFAFLSGADYLMAAILTTILAVVSWILNIKLKDNFTRDFMFLAIGTITFIIIIVGINEPINYHRNITKPFVKKVENLRSQQYGEIIFYRIYPDNEAIKFMANLDKPITPGFTNNTKDILTISKPVYFIALQKDFTALPENITPYIKLLDFGKIGRDDCVIFVCK